MELVVDILSNYLTEKDLVKIVVQYLKKDTFFIQTDKGIAIVNLDTLEYKMVVKKLVHKVDKLAYFGGTKLYFSRDKPKLEVGYFDITNGRSKTLIKYDRSNGYSNIQILYNNGNVFVYSYDKRFDTFDHLTDQLLHTSLFNGGSQPIIYQEKVYLFGGKVIEVYDLSQYPYQLVNRVVSSSPFGYIDLYQSRFYLRHYPNIEIRDVNTLELVGNVKIPNFDIIELRFYQNIALVSNKYRYSIEGSTKDVNLIKRYDSNTFQPLNQDLYIPEMYISSQVIGNQLIYYTTSTNGNDAEVVFVNLDTGKIRSLTYKVKDVGHGVYTYYH